MTTIYNNDGDEPAAASELVGRVSCVEYTLGGGRRGTCLSRQMAFTWPARVYSSCPLAADTCPLPRRRRNILFFFFFLLTIPRH